MGVAPDWQEIVDWDAAYANAAYIRDGDSYPGRWAAAAERFRTEASARHGAECDIGYGAGEERQRFDLFRPAGPPRGLLVFIHGGYWLAFDKSTWSHLAAGPLAAGWAVAIPSYRLCPDVDLPAILQDAAAAVAAAAARVPSGPVHLVGHSAGGQLVCRLLCEDSPLDPSVAARLGRVVSIAGLHDLRPLLRTAMAPKLHLDKAVALAESPLFGQPRPGVPLIAWVGRDERPEFRRQAALLASAWLGCGARTALVEAADRHHFSVIGDLGDPDSALTAAACAVDVPGRLS